MLVKSFIWEEEERRWWNPTFQRSVSQLPCTQMYVRVFLWTSRQHHSICMLGLGFIASLVIIWVIHNYGEFEISLPSLNRESYCILWYYATYKLWPANFRWLMFLVNTLYVYEVSVSYIHPPPTHVHIPPSSPKHTHTHHTPQQPTLVLDCSCLALLTADLQTWLSCGCTWPTPSSL